MFQLDEQQINRNLTLSFKNGCLLSIKASQRGFG